MKLFLFSALSFILAFDRVFAQTFYAEKFNYAENKNAYHISIQSKKGETNDYDIPKNLQGQTTFILTYVSETAFLSDLDQIDNILAIINPQYVYNEKIRNFLKNKRILSIISASNALPSEEILKLAPTYYSLDVLSKKDPALKVLSLNKINVIKPVYFLEKTPLARAEWIKFYGILTGRLKQSEAIFKKIEAAYLKEKDWVSRQNNEKKPSVILDLPYQGVWYTASSSSLMAKLIEDAGGNYLTKNIKNKELFASLSLSQEDLVKELAKTDVWIIKSNERLTRKDLLQRYPYLEKIPNLKRVRIYNSSKKLYGQANDVFESGDLHAERMLSDVIAMLRPKLAGNKQLYYYEEVQ